LLRPNEAYHLRFSNKIDWDLDPQVGFWLYTNLKNKKEILLDIWIPNMLNIKNNNSTLPFNDGNPNLNIDKLYALSIFHVIEDLKQLILNSPDFLFVKKDSNTLITYPNYKKMMKEGLRDIGVTKNFGPYSLKHAAIDKLVRQGCVIAEINKRQDMP
jgi:hypothetical protein